MTNAMKREFKRLYSEAARIESAVENLRKVVQWIEYIDGNIRPVIGIYTSGYTPRVDVTLEALVVKTFNDGEFAALLDGIREQLYVDANDIHSEDSPETRCRSFVMHDTREGISMEYILRAYLSEGDATCQIIVERVEEVETEKWVTVKETRPVLRFVCPEE